jgi:hypothetical protein
MGSCYSKKVKEYDEIISSGTDTVIERIGKRFDKFSFLYNGHSYIWNRDSIKLNEQSSIVL